MLTWVNTNTLMWELIGTVMWANTTILTWELIGTVTWVYTNKLTWELNRYRPDQKVYLFKVKSTKVKSTIYSK